MLSSYCCAPLNKFYRLHTSHNRVGQPLASLDPPPHSPPVVLDYYPPTTPFPSSCPGLLPSHYPIPLQLSWTTTLLIFYAEIRTVITIFSLQSTVTHENSARKNFWEQAFIWEAPEDTGTAGMEIQYVSTTQWLVAALLCCCYCQFCWYCHYCCCCCYVPMLLLLLCCCCYAVVVMLLLLLFLLFTFSYTVVATKTRFYPNLLASVSEKLAQKAKADIYFTLTTHKWCLLFIFSSISVTVL